MSGAELKAWREEQGWSKYRLARELGVQQSTILRWENNTHPVPKMAEIALRALGRKPRTPRGTEDI